MQVKDYRKKNLHEHILSRPEIYIGSTEKQNENIFAYDTSQEKIKQTELEYVPAFIKLFDEILVNAIDHSVKEPLLTAIKVVIEDDCISVYNNGTGIPVELHPEYNVYAPELIFGNLLTSSNYDDDVERITGGLNGLGSKLTNVFSKRFIVETFDGKNVYKQEFCDNMTSKKKPSIKKSSSTTQYTKITYYPDLSRFNMTSISPKGLLYKRVYDTVICTNQNVSVYLDGKKISKGSNKFKDYLSLYESNFTTVLIEKKYTWEIAVGISTRGFQQVSFVNGVCTIHGGKHVDYVVNQLVKKLSAVIKTKKKIEVKQNYIKDNLFVVIKSVIASPKFSSQSKEFLTTTSKDFISFDLPEDFVNKFYKSSNIGDIVEQISSLKDKQSLDKGLSNSKKSTVNVPNLDDATYAGTSKSNRCSLMLTEGLSAKTFAVSGLSVIGRQYYGIWPLKGKVLNVREATAKQLLNNEEVLNIKKILGLQNSKTYKTEEEFNTLRYSAVIILTDADADGKHISSLLVNMFHYFWPELLKKPGFIKRLQTPIVKVSRGKQSLEFYSENEYKIWQKKQSLSWNIKYYKGLGTSTSTEAKEIFKNFEKNIITYVMDDLTDEYITLAFDKKNADKRKEWLKDYDPEVEFVCEKQAKFSDSIDKELIQFSAYDNIRSIPNIMDGLKPSQRKVLYTMFKRNQTKEVKVAQLGSAVAEITDYHHGEMSLYSTIIGMAQNYPGSNNINLLKPCGQFGSRIQLGKDAASPRYIFTHLEDITTKIFDPEDNNIIDYNYSDTQQIEPKYYVPSIPMILVNGAIGIGTGYSTNIPQYNPEDIITNIKNILDKKPMKQLIPYYRGFRGTITPDQESFKMYGKVEKGKAKDTLLITEIPTTSAIESYKEFLINHLPNYKIVNNSTENEVNISIVFPNSDEFSGYINKGRENIYKDLKLISKINTSNFYLFGCDQKLKKFSGPNEIIEYFVQNKLIYLQKRKEYLITKSQKELDVLKNKKRFLEEIMNDTIVVYKKRKNEIEEILKKSNYSVIDNTFNYLTSMNISSFNVENLDTLDKKIAEVEQKLQKAMEDTPKKMFVDGLSF